MKIENWLGAIVPFRLGNRVVGISIHNDWESITLT